MKARRAPDSIKPGTFTTAHATGLAFALLLAVQCASCTSSTRETAPPNPGDCDVVIGAIRADLQEEQRALYWLLKSHDIRMSLEGSRVYDVLVPSNKAELARGLLRTNDLVSGGLLRLWRNDGSKE